MLRTATARHAAAARLEPLESRLLLAGDLVISEFMAHNVNGLTDQDGAHSDWIEIRNVSAAAVNLDGWGLTDNASSPLKWRFPAMDIPAGGYLLVFASGKDRAIAGSQLHTNFQLDTDGEYLAIRRPDSSVEHEYAPAYPPQAADVSYGLMALSSSDTLLPDASEGTALVPADGSLALAWAQEGFDDSGWDPATMGIGYDNGVIYQPGGSVTLLDSPAPAVALVPASDIGATWRNLGYTPSGWLNGNTGMGYERSTGYESWIGLNVNAAMYNVRTSAYLRVQFQVADPALLTSLTLQMRYDDGFVAYINGQKVAHQNDPATLVWNSAATANVEAGSSYVSYDVTSYISSLVAGTNVLAIQGLNTTLTSSDFLIQPRLTADVQVPTYAYFDLIQTNIEPQMAGQNASAYVRLPFELQEEMPDVLKLRVKYDDGFIAYLNGVEVARRNAPASPQWNSTATLDRTDAQGRTEELIDISASTGLLHPGTNVLAIQGLNYAASDTDFLLCPQMDAAWTQQMTQVSRYFLVPTPGVPNGSGSLDLGPIITNVLQSPAVPADSDPITVTAQVRQSFAPVGAVRLTYLVMYGSPTTLDMYDDGAHGDGASGDGVYGVSIPASASTPGQMVRYYVTATDGTATSRWPLYAITSGARQSEQYLGTVIADSSYSTQLPVFHFFAQSATGADSPQGTRGSVYYLGEFYDNVYIRQRGGTINSGMAEGAGQSRKIEFNADHHFLYDPLVPRVNEININCPGPQDGSYLRQELSFWLYDQAGVAGEQTFLMHVRQNGAYMGVRIFHEQPNSDMLKREGLDEDGALYQTGYCLLADTNLEKKNPKPITADKSDLQALVDGINPSNPNRNLYVMDNLNLPALVNYLAVEALIQDGDCTTHNWMVYRDVDTGEWMYIGHDRDLTWGDWVDSGADWGTKTTWNESSSSGDRYWMHPFYASSEYPHPDKFNTINRQPPYREWVRLNDAIHDNPVTAAMFYRRLRTLMDEFLKAPGTPYAQLPLEARIDSLVSQLAYEQAHNMLPPQGSAGTFLNEINSIKNYYIAGRRNYLYGAKGPWMQMISQAGLPAWIVAPAGDQAAPAAQPASFAHQVVIASVDAAPISGNQDQEYVQLSNPNSYAVDISGWKLSGGIDFTFPAGSVIVAGGSVYVTPDSAAFRARTSGPGANQGLFVLGGYDGHLNAGGDQVSLLDPANAQIDSLAIEPPSAVINEVLSNPTGGVGDWIELYNPTASDINIGGWYLSDSLTTPLKHRIPDGTIIAHGGYQVFTEQGNFGTAFGLSKYGERVVLSKPDGTTVDSHDFDASEPLMTFGRYVNTDGKADFTMLSAATFGTANAAPLIGPVLINEIMYHPLDVNDEFIELHNTSGSAVTLYDISAPSHTWTIGGGVDYTFPQGVEMPSGGYIVVAGLDVSEPDALASFKARNHVPAGVGVYGPFTGQLNNAGESITLNRPWLTDPGSGLVSRIRVDRVEYSDALPWPLAADGAGPALERISGTRYGNESGNWRVTRDGGSAGLATLRPGDANGDGSVDGADYTIWADHLNQTGMKWEQGDFNRDGWPDGADYTLWADSYAVGGGSAPPAGGSSATGGSADQQPPAQEAVAAATTALAPAIQGPLPPVQAQIVEPATGAVDVLSTAPIDAGLVSRRVYMIEDLRARNGMNEPWRPISRSVSPSMIGKKLTPGLARRLAILAELDEPLDLLAM